ncbi:MAG: C25 family cysteine peptidase [Chloroherpetonaceae bacterium]|nr:C25 family cysteine peptidase [Chloroherpetonaceae bacterium]
MKSTKQVVCVAFCLCALPLFASLAQNSESSSPKSSLNLPLKNAEVEDVKASVKKVEPRGSDKVVMELEFDEPKIVTETLPNGATIQRIEVGKRENQCEHFVYPIPYFAYEVQGKILSARVVSSSGQGSVRVALPFNAEAEADTPIGLPRDEVYERKTTTKPTEAYPKKRLDWFFAGSMRGTDVSSLVISPYIYDPRTQTLSYATRFVVELSLGAERQNASQFKVGIDEKELLSKTPVKRERFKPTLVQANAIAPTQQPIFNGGANAPNSQLARPFSGLPVVPKYRIIINEDGLYRIGYFEFLDNDLPQDFFNADPRTYRIFNKGREIPIFVRGENDGRFNRDDFIEFFGEKHQIGGKDTTRPDMYRDPYSEENVYYLYWEPTLTTQNRGLRLTEVSGEIRNPIPPNSPFFAGGTVFRSFRSTLHFEVDPGEFFFFVDSAATGWMFFEQRLSGFYDPIRTVAYQRTRNHSDSRDKLFWTQTFLNRREDFLLPIPYPDIQLNPITLNDDYVEITAAFHGISRVSVQNAQNIASITLNNLRIGTAEWGIGSNSQIPHIWRVRFEQAFHANIARGLKDEDQLIQLSIANEDRYNEGGAARSFAFNWFRISYKRLYRAYQNEIAFTTPPRAVPGRYQFQISGFTSQNIDLYKKGVGRITNFILRPYREPDGQGGFLPRTYYQIVFQDDVVNPESVEYLAIETTKKKLPLRFEKVTPADYYNPARRLVDRTNNYNFILITSNAFITEQSANNPQNEIFQYKQHREAVLSARGENPSVLVTTVESIYDEFNYGIASPYAVREFLNYAYREWQQPPTYVFLVGPTRFGRIQRGDVPTFHVQTFTFGATPSDSWFAMIDGIDQTGQLDLVPDMQIARLQVFSRQEVGVYLEKLKKYELTPTINVWRNKVLLIAGEAEGTTNVTGADGNPVQNNKILQTDSLVEQYVNRAFFIDRLHTGVGRLRYESGLDTDRYIGDTQRLLNLVNQGYLVVNFMGHGGGAIWGDGGLLDNVKARLLDNFNVLPFVTSFTCFVGAVDSPLPLSRTFLISRRKGAIGVIASAGYGWFLNDFLMAQAVFDFLLNERYQGLSIGDMMFRGKIRYYLRYINVYPDQAPSQMHQYGVLGDPAVRLSSPQVSANNRSRIRWNLPTHIAPIGSTLRIVGTVDGIQNGVGEGRITDQNNYDVSVAPIPFIVQNGRIGQLRNGVFVDTLFVQIPNPPRGRGRMPAMTGGHFKAYVRSVDGNADANGVVRFSTAAPFFRRVEPTSDFATTQNQAQRFVMEVESRQNVSRVDLDVVVEAIDPAKLSLTNPADTSAFSVAFQRRFASATSAPNVYQTIDSIPANLMREPNRVTYRAVAQTDSGQFFSDRFIAQVGNPPDIAAARRAREGEGQLFDNNTIDFYPDGDRVVIAADVYNWTDRPVERAVVYFYENSISNGITPNQSPYLIASQIRLIDTVSVSLPANASARAKIPVPSWMRLLETYRIGVRVLADTTGQRYESTYFNNLSNQRAVQYNLFRVRTTADSIVVDENVRIVYDANTFSQNGFVRISREPNPPKVNQPDNVFLRFESQANPSERLAYRIQPYDTTLKLIKPLTMRLRLSPDEPQQARENAAAYFFSAPVERWFKVVEQTRLDSLTIQVQSSRFGAYALMSASDAQRPIVTLGIEGQAYRPGSAASRRPRITVVVQDQNGVYLDEKLITVIRNGDSSEALKSRLTVPRATPNANVVAMTYDDEFDAGENSLQFVFHDANLNQTRSEKMIFNVSSDFELIAHGAYPNPFNERTFIAYEIINPIQEADAFELKIFTVSGRLIATCREPGPRSLDAFPTGSQVADGVGQLRGNGDHALIWTGKDDGGNEVANGVYYGKLRITSRGRALEKIVKIVRLR